MPRRATSAGRSAVMSRPPNTMRPRLGVKNLLNRLKQVVLPAPFGPIMAWMDPRATRRLTPRTATNPAKSLVRFSVSRTVSLLTTFPPGPGIVRQLKAWRKGPQQEDFCGLLAAAAEQKPARASAQRRARSALTSRRVNEHFEDWG